MAKQPKSVAVSRDVAGLILTIRGQRVMLDTELARLYGVHAKQLNQQMKRNRARFPADFMFQLTREEYGILRSQTVTSRSAWGGRRYLPFAFTEHGAVMLSMVLKSRRAVDVSVQIVRAFIQLRGLMADHIDLGRKLDQLERKYDAQFKVVFDAIRELMRPTEPPPHKQIGFRGQARSS